jgi:hypothetical protein
MNAMRFAPLLLALGFALSGCAAPGGAGLLAADAPRALPGSGPVSVAWTDPAGFSELRFSGNRFESARGRWLSDLATYLRDRAAARLPAGERLELTITDVQRAGRYEPMYRMDMQDVRVVRDIYPPRITLRFRHFDASGTVVSEGERTLTDPGFLTHAVPLSDSDTLRYEKRMIDGWLRSEFRTAAR